MYMVIPALVCAALAAAQQSDPKPPPQGSRKDPGLFGGMGDRKKGDDENQRAVAGVVSDSAGNPVSGAVVHLKDTRSLRVRSYNTKEDGTYRFFGLSTNIDYELRAGHGDLSSDTRVLSVFDSKKQAVLNLTVKPKREKK